MAGPTGDWDDDENDDNFVVLGTAVPELPEGQPQKKPTTVQDLTARDKQGRRRFHGAFTGGFSAGFFNTVGTKEGFTPSTFVSSRSNKGQRSEGRPEDYMDEEDFDEHGIAPRKFATTESYSSEDRKRKLPDQLAASSHLAQPLTDLITPEQLSIGIKILRKMGWRQGQGLGPRVKKKKKKPKGKNTALSSNDSSVKVYGCALPPPVQEDCQDSDDDFVPEDMSNISFAPKDVCPISLEAKDNVHGLGYRGLDPSLALPSSYINRVDSQPVRSHKGGRGIQGQAFGVGAFERDDEDIYAVDNMSRYDITMRLDDEDEVDTKFGWTAPSSHGKQVVPVSYVGKLLQGFTLSSQPLQPKKKYLPPVLPRDFKPHHWSRRRREASLAGDGHGASQRGSITSVERGLMLGETPIMDSVFDLVPKEDKNRIEATKQAIAMTKALATRAGSGLASRFQPSLDTSAAATTEATSEHTSGHSGITDTYLAKFKPADVTPVEPLQDVEMKVAAQFEIRAPLFQGGLNFQPFRKDAAKQARYDTYLAALKQGAPDPYLNVENRQLTEWEKSREREEFSKASKIYRPMSAMMSSRFVRGAMIDDDKAEATLDSEKEKTDEAKAAEMKMFGKLTREELEWHPDKLLCRRFNVPNPYPESDLVGVPSVKRDKYSVFNFLSLGDYQPEVQDPPAPRADASGLESRERTMKPIQSRKAAMSSIFKVLDDPDFHQPGHQIASGITVNSPAEVNKDKINEEGGKVDEGDESEADKDLFRAIFKNSDSESSSDESEVNVKNEALSEDEENRGDSETKVDFKTDLQEELLKPGTGISREGRAPNLSLEDLPASHLSAPSTAAGSLVKSRSRWSRLGEKSVFSVLDDLDKDGSTAKPEAILSRLSPSNSSHHMDEGGSYEVKLPPEITSATDTVSYKRTSNSETLHKTDDPKDREHRHKKEKKKKSKHKKVKKHKKHKKSNKSTKSHKEKASSGSEADTETSEVSDGELLQKLVACEHVVAKVGFL